MKELVKNKIVSDKDFAQAEQSYENARLSYEALSKNHSAIGQSITAPIAGYVKSVLVKEGDYVTIGQPLVSVTQNRRLFLRAEVSEKYYPYLRTISSANFQTPYGRVQNPQLPACPNMADCTAILSPIHRKYVSEDSLEIHLDRWAFPFQISPLKSPNDRLPCPFQQIIPASAQKPL